MAYPLVSVCIPNYNYEIYIDECICSVLEQSYPRIETVFVDNCSDDASVARARKYSDAIRIFINDGNLGMVRNFNKCSEHSTGKYLVFLSTDDCLKPDFLIRCVEVMEAHDHVGIVICEREEMGAHGETLEPLPFFYDCSCIVPSHAQISVMMMTGIGVPCQVMVRRSVFEASGRYSERFAHAFDWHSNFKCVLQSNLAYIHERLARYRVFPGNSTAVMTRNMGMPLEHYLLLLELKELAQRHGYMRAVERYPEALQKLALMCLRYSFDMIRNSQNDMAKRYLHLAQAYLSSINTNSWFMAISKHLYGGGSRLELEMQLNRLGFSLRRTKSYSPPKGYLDLDI
jgi:glycosyltransferase involved in cell wall biosynthesis